MPTAYLFRPMISLITVLALSLIGCDDQRSIADTPKPALGVKAGETLPLEPDKGPQRNHDGNVQVPAATAPTTPGELNSPGAPVPLTPPPASAPSNVPAVVPRVHEPGTGEPSAGLGGQSGLGNSRIRC